MDDLEKAIHVRRSRRKYLPEALEASVVQELQDVLEDLNNQGAVKMRLVVDNGKAFDGLMKSYGMFSGVRNYITLIGREGDAAGWEKLGYYGEKAVLYATSLGLGTCWVGGAFDRASCPVELERGERVVCTIALGLVSPDRSRKERFIHRLVHRKTKTIQEMIEAEGQVPEWFWAGMQAVQKAPSAANKQPVTFAYKKGVASASVQNIAGSFNAVDLGIAKLHFALGAGRGSWSFGNGASFLYLSPNPAG